MLGTMNSIGDYYNQMAALQRVSQQFFNQSAASHGGQIASTTNADCSSYLQVKTGAFGIKYGKRWVMTALIYVYIGLGLEIGDQF